MILGEATGGVLNCLSPAKRDEFLGRPEQAIEASKYAAANEGNLALCRVINILLSMSLCIEHTHRKSSNSSIL
jgi:hypothetical protein